MIQTVVNVQIKSGTDMFFSFYPVVRGSFLWFYPPPGKEEGARAHVPRPHQLHPAVGTLARGAA